MKDNGNTAFTCKFDDNSAVPWMTLTNNQQLSSNGAVVPPINTDRPTISLQCQSQKTGQWTDLPTPGAGIFTIDVAPVLKSPTDSTIPALTSIKFDAIDANSGIKLSDLLVSGSYGAKITLSGSGTNSNYVPANWVVTANGQYLNRQLVNNQIDAGDLVNNNGKVNISMQVTNTTSSLSATAAYPFTLLPDPELSYKYVGTGLLTSLQAFTPENYDPTLVQTSAYVDASTVQGFMTDANKASYLVINDSNFVFSAPDNPPGFINYKTSPKINIGFPPYSDLGGPPIKWQVNTQSTANGSTPKAMDMPPFTVNSVILAPPDNNGVSGIMTLGTTHQGNPPPSQSQYYWTYLWLQLKPNTTYKVMQVKYDVSTNGTIFRQICTGQVTKTLYADDCGSGSTLLAHLPASSDTTGNTSFTTDGTGVVTFMVALLNSTGMVNGYPKFKTAPEDPNSGSANIVLKLQ